MYAQSGEPNSSVTAAVADKIHGMPSPQSQPSIFDDIPHELPKELTQSLLTRPNLRIERIVSAGHASPEGFWYDQPRNEWVLLVRGAARLRFEGGEIIEMTSGSYVHIPAHQKHRVERTDPNQPTIWLAVHY